MFNCLARTAILVALLAPSDGFAQTSDAEQTVREFLVPFAARDFERFIPYFAEEATMFFPPANSAPAGLVRGRANIERAFKALYDAYPRPAGAAPTPITPKELLVQQSDDYAIVTFLLGNETAPGRRTLVLRRMASQWRIVHLHGSSVTSP